MRAINPACLACLLLVGASSRLVVLRTGVLDVPPFPTTFSSALRSSASSASSGAAGGVAAALPAAGPWVVSTAVDVALGTARAAVVAAFAAADNCGAVVGVLPPYALLLHVRSTAPCGAALVALSPAIIDGLAGLPAYLRTDVSSTTAQPVRRRALQLIEPSPSPQPSPPLRAVALLLAAELDGIASLERFVETALVDSCATCSVVRGIVPNAGNALSARAAALGSPQTATVVSAGARCGEGCELDAPASCGCLLSLDAVTALAGFSGVLWLDAATPAQTSNAYSRGVTMTTDLPDATLFGGEWGVCRDLGACAQLANAPFSVLPALYPAALTGRGAIRSAAVDAAVPAGACSALCASPACGQGFATCGGLESPLTALGLNGSGQLLHIIDSGLDYTHPLFADAGVAVAPSQASSPLTLSTAHRKIASYYAFCDAFDAVGGHGSHTSGTLVGAVNLSAVNTADAAVLSAVHGVAPAARVLFSDAGCSTSGGCVLPRDAPSGTCPNSNICPADATAVYLPADLSFLFLPQYHAGARVASNSWGGGEGRAYSVDSYVLDVLAYSAADFLLVFAAGNGGAAGGRTVSVQTSAKNVLSVGAAISGMQARAGALRGGAVLATGAHLPPLVDRSSYSGCDAILYGAALAGFGCPPAGLPTAAECYAVATASLVMGPLPFVGLFDPVPTDAGRATMDVALCCGCSPRQVLDGAADAGALPVTLRAFEAIYNAREAVYFSSRGPTSDGRIAPSLIAPGTRIVSTYASGTVGAASAIRRYGDFRCAAGASVSGDPGAADAPSSRGLALSGKGFAPTIGNYMAYVLSLATLLTLEPTVLQQLTINVSAVAVAGTLYLQLIDDLTSETSSVFTAALAVGATSATLAVNATLRAGQTTFLAFFASADTTFVATAVATARVTQAACFGALQYRYQSILTSLVTTRGAGIAYTKILSGTSMATPHVAGLAALARQYLAAGFFPSGVRTPAAGFAPSSALLKALLVNSASPVMEPALAALLSLPPPMAPPLVMTNDAGAGVVNLMRGLAFASALLPNATALLLPGLTVAPYAAPAGGLPPPDGAPLAGVDPEVSDGGLLTFCVDVTAELPTWLSVTLVWTDPPALPLAAIQLVNNLDLEVLPPSGDALLRGNNDGGQSPQTADTLNNVEKLYIASAVRTLTREGVRLAPAYAVRVRGAAVVIAPQAFSLVVNGVGAQLAPNGTCGIELVATPSSALSTSQQLGLGIGIGLGLAAALLAAATAAVAIVAPPLASKAAEVAAGA